MIETLLGKLYFEDGVIEREEYDEAMEELERLQAENNNLAKQVESLENEVRELGWAVDEKKDLADALSLEIEELYDKLQGF